MKCLTTGDSLMKNDGESQKAFHKDTGNNNIAAQTFTFRELATATKNFRQECLLGEGGFGRVYRGRLEKPEQVTANLLFYHIEIPNFIIYIYCLSLDCSREATRS